MARPLVYAALAGGILVVSTAAILIRVAQAEGAPSLAIAALRLTIASAILVPFAWVRARSDAQQLSARDLWITLVSGACLALHFAAWITSLEFTSVASSTALVTTNPIWVGIGSVLLLRERVSRGMMAGISVAVFGTLVLLFSDVRAAEGAGEHTLLGNVLALIGALSASAYLLIGRWLRHRLDLTTYVAMVYGAASVLLTAATLVKGDALTGFTMTAYLCIAGLAIGPQLIGHTILNWSVRQMPATVVALSILGEPIGSSMLAIFLLGEAVAPVQGVAFLLILAGIYLAVRDDSPVKHDVLKRSRE